MLSTDGDAYFVINDYVSVSFCIKMCRIHMHIKRTLHTHTNHAHSYLNYTSFPYLTEIIALSLNIECYIYLHHTELC